jgi:1,4-alpha-glucan branching enzyme
VSPPLRWTVRNKIKKFAASAGQLITLKVLGTRAETEKQPHERKMTFSLYAPEAGYVSLAGDFNSWNPDVHPLEKSSDGLWERVICLPPGRYEYKFFVDGQWHNDPRCTVYTSNPFGGENCVVILS